MKTFLSATEMSENACISLRQISSYVQGKTEGTFWIFSRFTVWLILKSVLNVLLQAENNDRSTY